MTRIFDAPRSLVFDAWTKPELLQQWLGVFGGFTMPVCDVELRVGGTYRYVWEGPEGMKMGVRGEYRDIEAPVRIVATERYDEAWYAGEALITHVLEEVDGKTTSTITMHYESTAARDAVLASPMKDGFGAGCAGLDQLLVRLATHTNTPGARHLLRHTLATLAYRAEKVLRDVPADFVDTRMALRSRTPLEILSHLADLMHWGGQLARGEDLWKARPANTWNEAADRFFERLAALDRQLPVLNAAVFPVDAAEQRMSVHGEYELSHRTSWP